MSEAMKKEEYTIQALIEFVVTTGAHIIHFIVACHILNMTIDDIDIIVNTDTMFNKKHLRLYVRRLKNIVDCEFINIIK